GLGPCQRRRQSAIVSGQGGAPRSRHSSSEKRPARLPFALLADSYSGPGRYYHTLQHLDEVLVIVDQFRTFPHFAVVELAAWFHDVVYDARTSDSEAKSAAWAGETLRRLQVAQDTIQRTGELILYTKAHEAPKHDVAAAILLDADLAILGADDARYADY